MSNSNRDAPFWSKASAATPLQQEAADAAAAMSDRSSPATQIARDRDDYLGETALDVGRQTRTNEHELFVSCNPAPAMQQQFEHLRPEFIAVHDIGTSSSRKLLDSLASASGHAVQKLVIRRQGYGTALATIHFVELPSAAGTRLRMYSTDCETEPSWRQSLAHMLLAFSRLGVIMVGDMKPADIATALEKLRDSMLRGPWLNDQLLLLPRGSASSLVTHGMELARGTNANVRTTPQVARATDAWGFISGTWNRLTDKNPAGSAKVAALAKLVAATGSQAGAEHGEAPAMPAIAPAAAAQPTTEADASQPGDLDRQFAPTQRTAMDSPRSVADRTPPAASASPTPPATADILRRYVRQINELAGVIGCTVFDAANGNRVAYAGSGPSAASLATQGAALLAAILKTSSALELGRALPEAAITLESHHLLLRAVPRHPGLVLHAVLDKDKANLTLVRLQVLRLDTLFEETP